MLVATAGTVVLTLGVLLMLNGSRTHQGEAKDEGPAAAMALARAGAITTDMQADQSRYLIDDVFSDNYQQVYLERSQQVLFRYSMCIERLARGEVGAMSTDDLILAGFLAEDPDAFQFVTTPSPMRSTVWDCPTVT